MDLDDGVAAADGGAEGEADDVPEGVQAEVLTEGIGAVAEALAQGDRGGEGLGHGEAPP